MFRHFLFPLAILSLSSAPLSSACEVHFHGIFAKLIDPDSTTGWIASPPTEAGWRTVSIAGKARGGWVQYRKHESGERILEFQSISGGETWRFDSSACLTQHRRTTPSRDGTSETTHGFSSMELNRWIARQPRGLVYLWSPSLPLSVDGVRSIRRVARSLGLPIQVLMDARASRELIQPLIRRGLVTAADTRHANAREFRILGGTRQFPSVLVFKQGRFTSLAHIGRRTEAEWKHLIREELQRARAYASSEVAMREAERKLSELWLVKFNAQATLSFLRQYDLALGLGHSTYFQPIPNQPWVADYDYTDPWRINLVHQGSGAHTTLGLKGGDPYPFPDGRMIIVPERSNESILHFYTLDQLLSHPSQPTPAYTDPDPSLIWWYSSVGVTAQHSADHYEVRVLTKAGGLRVDHYMIDLSNPAVPRVSRSRAPESVCANLVSVSAPVLSRDARFVAVTDKQNQKKAIYRIPDRLSDPCDAIVELPFESYKVAWDPQSSNRFTFSFEGANGVENYLFDLNRNLARLPNRTPECNGELISPRIIGPSEILFVCRSPSGDGRKHLYYQVSGL